MAGTPDAGLDLARRPPARATGDYEPWHAGPFLPHRVEHRRTRPQRPAAARPGKSRISNPSYRASPRNTIIESTFEVGRRFRCTMRVDCGQLDPDAVIRPEPAEWHPRMPERLDEEELADWRAGRNAVYQLAALTIGGRRRIADVM
jgi:hypothetical protein